MEKARRRKRKQSSIEHEYNYRTNEIQLHTFCHIACFQSTDDRPRWQRREGTKSNHNKLDKLQYTHTQAAYQRMPLSFESTAMTVLCVSHLWRAVGDLASLQMAITQQLSQNTVCPRVQKRSMPSPELKHLALTCLADSISNLESELFSQCTQRPDSLLSLAHHLRPNIKKASVFDRPPTILDSVLFPLSDIITAVTNFICSSSILTQPANLKQNSLNWNVHSVSSTRGIKLVLIRLPSPRSPTLAQES